MQKDINQNQDTLYQEQLKHCQVVQEAIENGIWEQEHGVVLDDYSQPTKEDWDKIREEIRNF